MSLANLLKPSRAADLLAGAAIVALALIAYVNSFPGAFILDDHGIVVFNPLVDNFDLYAILRTEYWGTELNSGLYRPLTIFSLALNQAIFGSAPWGFHLVNVLLHAGVALLLFLVLCRWSFPRGIALLAAMIFAVHPIHSEVVNEVVGRSELLAALFALAALLCARDPGPKGNLLTAGSFLLALLAKEHVMTLLVIIPLFDAFIAQSRQAWRPRLPLYLSLATIALLWLVWKTFGVIHSGRPEIPHPLFVPLYYLDIIERLLAAIQLQWFYLGKLLAPLHQQAVYSGGNFFTPVLTRPLFISIAALAGTTGIVALVLLQTARWNKIAFPFLIYLVAVLPTANLLFPISVNFAERLTYFPSLWFSLFFATLLAQLLRKDSGYWLAGSIYVIFLLGLCLARNPAFADERHLWRTEVETDPANVVAWFYLAKSLDRHGERAAGEEAMNRVLSLAPDFSGDLNRTAALMIESGRSKEGIGLALQALGDPFIDRVATLLILADGFNRRGEYGQALAYLERISPTDERADSYWELLGRAYQGLERHAEAAQAFARVRSRVPHSAE